MSVHMLTLTLSIATPLFLAAIGGLLNERVGIVNVGLEGIMLTGAFSAVLVSYYTGSPWLGVLASLGSGMLLGLLHAAVCIGFRSDHVISGVAINILAGSLTVFLLQLFFNNKGQSPSVTSVGSVGGIADGVPVLGTVVHNMNWLTLIGLVVVGTVHIFLYRTKLGLRYRSVGENPAAAQSLGIPVKVYMYIGVIAGCALVGLAGAYLSIGMLNVFTKNMSAGRGFIALAVVVFGRWTPFGSLLASLFFGYVMALQYSFQALPVPPQLLESIPYIATLLVLVFTYRNAKGPAFAGRTLQLPK
ncbi:ABC transporter permease [Paenibacillus sp. PastF-2]|uniref:ABC transporter permease n=1 Tax=Paenibacillus sp. PastF-2 TaxID=2940532 RepID=UPI002404A385|nr:ABC transporter permease [Paenibacillus sp. PastF-2]